MDPEDIETKEERIQSIEFTRIFGCRYFQLGEDQKPFLDLLDLMIELIRNEIPNIENLRQIMNKVDEIMNHKDYGLQFSWGTFRLQTFAKELCWAIPTEKAIRTICQWYSNHIKTYPNAKLVDCGAGSGVWMLLIYHYMLDNYPELCETAKDMLVAYDLPNPTYKFKQYFWPINSTYIIQAQDILMILWGSDQSNVIENFVENGGKRVIILGEYDGCTTDAGYFNDRDDWDVETVEVAGAIRKFDFLTLNTLDN